MCVFSFRRYWHIALLLAGTAGLFALARGLAAQDQAPAAEAPKPADAEKRKAPLNPLGQIFRNLFPPANQNRGVDLTPDSEKEAPANGDETARDRIDARAPYDLYQAKRLRTAAQHIERAATTQRDSEWKAALDLLQRVLDEPGDSLVRRPDGTWVSVRDEANRMLSRLPPRLAEQYRQQYGALAEQLFDEARRDSDLQKSVEVATRFFHTPAGRHAADFLGLFHLDRGEFGLAARWFFRLIDVEDPATENAMWRLRAAVAFREAGQTDLLRRMMERLAASDARTIRAGGSVVAPERWLADVGRLRPAGSESLDEWPMYSGNPSRTGRATGGEPLLLPRWSQPLTYSHPLREQIEELTYDLVHEGKPPLPAFHPLMVDDKVIFRTLRGVQVAEATSGRILWETREGLSPERLLGNSRPKRSIAEVAEAGVQRAIRENRWMSGYNGNGAEYHPLSNLLFRDGVWGMISSDGRHLFVIEDHAILSQYSPADYWSLREGPRDAHRRDWSSNKLVAYDLQTGRVEWEVGGQAIDEPFDRRLAGYYFFGPPTPDGGELFIVGEKDAEIRLFSLSSQTGRPNWSQLIAYSDSRIEQDMGRRWWTAQVAIAGGVVVCPTTAGWLVGVDRVNRSVLWASRYTRPETSRQRRGDPRAANLVPNTPLNQLWPPAAPVIAGDRAVYTPPDGFNAGTPAQPELVCVNLFDGSPVWQKPKGNFLYLAGVFGERVVLVGTDAVTALSLANGATLWSISLGNKRVSGTGIASGERYYLPLQSGELWVLDLDEGKLAAKHYQPEGAGLLGSLGMYRGMLVSLSPTGLTTFEQREAVLAEIARGKERDPRDGRALLREAEIEALNRRHQQALARLREIRPEDLPADLEPSYRRAMLQNLVAVIRADLQASEAELEELGLIVRTPDEQLLHRRLVAEQLHARKEYAAAFEKYMDLLGSGGDRMVARSDDPNTEVRLDHWVAGKLQSLWNDLPDDLRAELDASVDERRQQALQGDWQAKVRFASIFSAHPSSARVALDMARSEADDGEFIRAETRLLRVARRTDAQASGKSLERLGELMQEAALPADAAYFRARLTSRVEPSGETDAPGDPAKDGAGEGERSGGRRGWSNVDLRLEVSGTNHSSNVSRELQPGPNRIPFFQNHRFLYFQQHQRVGIVGPDDALRWMLPLRSGNRGSSGWATSQQVGHQLFVVHGGVLHAISPVERRVLWTRSLNARGTGHRQVQNAAQPMQVGTALASRNALRQSSAADGSVVAANCEYVCTYERRTAVVRDALTGEARWTRGGLPPNVALAGNADLLFVISRGDDEPLALRATDGEPLNIPDLAEQLASAVAVVPGGLIQVQSGTSSNILGLTRANLTIRAYDPIREQEHWQVEFPSNTYFSLLEDDRLAALELSGALHLVDLRSGECVECEALPESALKYRAEMHVITDNERAYLIVNQSRRRSYFYSSGGLPAMNINGMIYAFDLKDGRKLWEQKVLNQQLVLEQLTHSPVLLFSSRQYERQGNLTTWATNLVALDKVTGRELIETKLSSQYSGGIQSLKLNLAERTIELTSYNQRVRLVARDREGGAPVEAPKQAALAR